MIGNLTTCKGTVVATALVDVQTGSVQLKVEAADQRGDTTAFGWAVVLLPRRLVKTN